MPEQTTVDDIVAHVEATEGWYLTEDGELRRDLYDDGVARGVCACPISSIDDRAAHYWDDVAEVRQIADDVAEAIVDAADDSWGTGYTDYDIDDLRRRLLEAAKLTEVEDG